MQMTGTRALVRLSESDMTLTNLDEDLRGRPITDVDGNEIGKVDDLFVDHETGKVRMLLAGQGGILGLGKKHFLIPVDAITSVEPQAVRINVTGDRATLMPEFDETRGEPNFESVYTWWGYDPYWTPGYKELDFSNYGRRAS